MTLRKRFKQHRTRYGAILPNGRDVNLGIFAYYIIIAQRET